jgi:hypothetical protein
MSLLKTNITFQQILKEQQVTIGKSYYNKKVKEQRSQCWNSSI